MNKGLLSILLFVFSVSVLVLGPHTYAGFAEPITYSSERYDEIDAVVYPNPAEENIFVRLDLIDPALTNEPEIELEIRNILGNTMPLESERIDGSRIRIVTADYPSGYYLLVVRCRVCGENNRLSKQAFKFLKK